MSDDAGYLYKGDIRHLPDDWILDRAAAILRERTTKPRGIWLNAFSNVLTKEALKIRAERKPV